MQPALDFTIVSQCLSSSPIKNVSVQPKQLAVQHLKIIVKVHAKMGRKSQAGA